MRYLLCGNNPKKFDESGTRPERRGKKFENKKAGLRSLTKFLKL
jgi:hypothetical protein